MEQEEISNSGDDDDDENGGSPPREEIPCMFAACDPIQMVLPSLDGAAICASCLIDSAITDRYWTRRKEREEAKGSGKKGKKGKKGWKGKGYGKGKGKNKPSDNPTNPQYEEFIREDPVPDGGHQGQQGAFDCGDQAGPAGAPQQVAQAANPPMVQGRPIYCCFYARRGRCDFFATGRCSYAHVYFGARTMLREGDFCQRMLEGHHKFPCPHHTRA